MNLMSVISGWNRKLNLKNARAVFDRACELVGGESELASVFKQKRAFSVSSQAAVVDQLATGVSVEQLTVPTRHPTPTCSASPADIRAAKDRLRTKIGLKAFTAFMATECRGDSLEAQFPKVLAALGESAPAAIAPGKPEKLNSKIARIFAEGASSLKAEMAKSGMPATVPAAARPTPAIPKPVKRDASAGISLAEARKRIDSIIPAPALTGNDKRDWQALSDTLTRAGFDCPWSGEPAHPHALKLAGSGLQMAVHRQRSAALKKLFHVG